MAGRGTESLRDIEQRLKRALELRGAQDLDLGQVVVPVVIAHDATGPGWREQIERAFAFAAVVTGGGAVIAHLAVKPTSRPAAIDRVWVQMSVSTGVRLSVLGPGSGDPWAIGVFNTRWIERMQGTDDVAPIATGTQNTDALLYGLVTYQDLSGTTIRDIDTTGLVLEPGAKLIVQDIVNSNANMAVSFKGRML